MSLFVVMHSLFGSGVYWMAGGGGRECFKRGWGLKQSLRSAIFTNYHEPFCSIQNFLLGKPKLSKLQAFNNSSLGKIPVYGAFHLTCAMCYGLFLCVMFVLSTYSAVSALHFSTLKKSILLFKFQNVTE